MLQAVNAAYRISAATTAPTRCFTTSTASRPGVGDERRPHLPAFRPGAGEQPARGPSADRGAALREYRKLISNNPGQTVPGEEGKLTQLSVKLDRIQPDVQNGTTTYYLYSKDYPTKIFRHQRPIAEVTAGPAWRPGHDRLSGHARGGLAPHKIRSGGDYTPSAGEEIEV